MPTFSIINASEAPRPIMPGASEWIELPCDHCGTLVKRQRSELVYGPRNHVFCNRKCFGLYCAYTYGWGSETARRRRAEKMAGKIATARRDDHAAQV